MFAYAIVDYNFLETLEKAFIITARQNLFIQENILTNAVRQIAIAMNTNSAFTASFTEHLFQYQQLNLRHIRILRGAQPFLDFDTSENCCLYVTTKKAMNFQDAILSISIVNFKDIYVLVLD